MLLGLNPLLDLSLIPINISNSNNIVQITLNKATSCLIDCLDAIDEAAG